MDTSNTIRELEATKKQILSWADQIDATINTLKLMASFNPANGYSNGASNDTNNSQRSNKNELPEKYKDYRRDWSTKQKLAYVLKIENHFLHIRQIAEILHSLEPSIDTKDFISKLYPAVSELKKVGTITKYMVGSSNLNVFWGSPNWLGENGEPKAEHTYDETQVTSFGGEKIEI